ncbi:MAG: hypothetical protein ACRDO9_10340, partial [Gaiellales bacterium]
LEQVTIRFAGDSGDGVVFDSIENPFHYYAKRSSQTSPERLAPNENWRQLRSARNSRVWVVYGHPRGMGAIRASLGAAGFRLQAQRSFGEGIGVELFAQAGAVKSPPWRR